jgi:hypothetical protein
MIKAAGIQVVLCTNGIPLNRTEITERIIGLGVDAVSVSLDSPDPAYNDQCRPARNHQHGHADVIAGARRPLATRAGQTRPRVGLYMVVTRRNIQQVTAMGQLAADLGMDYFVPQPISLAPGHPLRSELGLVTEHATAVTKELTRLHDARLSIGLPDRSYAASFAATLRRESPGFVAGCFGGHTLFFIEPDGSVWDCPSYLKIAATPPSRHRKIRGGDARRLFGPAYQDCAADCGLFSRDCVNMWPLTGFALPGTAALRWHSPRDWEDWNGFSPVARLNLPRARELSKRLAEAGVPNSIGSFGLTSNDQRRVFAHLQPALCRRSRDFVDTTLAIILSEHDDEQRIAEMAGIAAKEITRWD